MELRSLEKVGEEDSSVDEDDSVESFATTLDSISGSYYSGESLLPS